jgi:hypothetical protein
MRLWSLHPSYLDRQGLVACWREGLLAEKVLDGKTNGYTKHPQLLRFIGTPEPLMALNAYLGCVAEEAIKRGYSFDIGKLQPWSPLFSMEITDQQLAYELRHLVAKLKQRDPAWLKQLAIGPSVTPNPRFTVISGDIASWEVVRP